MYILYITVHTLLHTLGYCSRLIVMAITGLAERLQSVCVIFIFYCVQLFYLNILGLRTGL